MLSELVRATATDGATLDGALTRGQGPSAPAPLDAVCLIHGTGGNFYNSTFFEFLAERFAERGSAALRGNTRGHDGISTLVTTKGPRRQGAAFEIVDECRHDLRWGHSPERTGGIHSRGIVKRGKRVDVAFEIARRSAALRCGNVDCRGDHENRDHKA